MLARILPHLAKLTRTSAAAELPSYAELYENHARQSNALDVVGSGDYHAIGGVELAILKHAGLLQNQSLLDFGCGVGRLAEHAIPYLKDGEYCGIDISETMVARARARDYRTPNCKLSWAVGDGGILNTFTGRTFDMACAFSVFTHMDLEDTLLHFQCLRRVIKPTGCVVASYHLLAESEGAKEVFNQSSVIPYQTRRRQVINVVTSRELIETVAQMSGWEVSEWISHKQPFQLHESQTIWALGQSVCVMRPTPE